MNAADTMPQGREALEAAVRELRRDILGSSSEIARLTREREQLLVERDTLKQVTAMLNKEVARLTRERDEAVGLISRSDQALARYLTPGDQLGKDHARDLRIAFGAFLSRLSSGKGGA